MAKKDYDIRDWLGIGTQDFIIYFPNEKIQITEILDSIFDGAASMIMVREAVTKDILVLPMSSVLYFRKLKK